ncbi:MAG: phage holin family protein [Gemmatimonadota bacterium]
MAHPGVLDETRPLGEILRDIAAHSEHLVRAEVQLVVAEAREEGRKLARRGTYAAVGAVVALLALAMLLLSIVYALSLIIAAWLSALIVGIALAGVATAFVYLSLRPQADEQPGTDIVTIDRESQWLAKRRN